MMINRHFVALPAAAALLALSSCGPEKNLYDPTANTAQYESYFQQTFGNINANQDWNSIAKVQSRVSVNLGLDQQYTVAIYSSNPLFDTNASMLAITQVREGQTASINFDAPNAQQLFYVGVFDTKGRGVTQTATLNANGVLEANVGAAAAGTRAVEDASVYPNYVKTLNDYLNPAGTQSDHQITIEGMKAYTALTDADVNVESDASNHTLSDLQYISDGNNGVTTFYIANGDGKHYRIPAGTEMTEVWHFNGDMNVINDRVVYVEGKCHLNGNTLNGVTLVVAAGGEIILDSNNNHFSCAGRLIVLPGGKVTASKNGVYFGVENGQANYNGGEIDFNGTLNLNGSDFYNNGTVNVDIFTGTADGSKCTNFGHITARTNSEAASAYNQDVVNGCYMHFTENCGMGGLILLDNSRLDVDGQLLLTGGPRNGNGIGANEMYNLSEINAGSIYWNNGVVNGPTAAGSFAVIKTQKSLISHANDLNVFNYVYFDQDPKELYDYQNNKLDTENPWTSAHHVLGGEDAWEPNEWSKCWCDGPIQNWSNEATSPFTIPAGDCTGNGYNDKDPIVVPIPSAPVYYSIAFEDLGSLDDFDFNDIVLYVAHDVQNNTADVKLMAAGGILTVKVAYNGTELFEKNDGKMTNTTAGTRKANITPIATKEVAFTSADDLKKFTLTVVKDNSVSEVISSAAVQGRAPQALIIPGQWNWPTERTNIKDAYTDFASWVSELTNTGWYENYTDGKVVK